MNFDLESLRSEILSDIEQGLYHGASYAVCYKGEPLVHESLGEAHKASGRVGRLDDIYLSFSLAKAFTTLAILKMVDEGLLSLETKVADLIPEFGVKGKENVTLWHLLTHTAGVSVYPSSLPMEEMGKLSSLVPLICDLPVESVPGEKVCYSTGSNHTIVGEMIRLLDPKKRSFRTYIKEEICDPLAMHDTGFGRPSSEERIVPVVFTDRTGNSIDPDVIEHFSSSMGEESEFPAGGLYTTTGDLIKFCRMLAKEGVYEEGALLSKTLFKEAVKNQTGEMRNEFFDSLRGKLDWQEFPAYIGLSFFLRGEKKYPSFLGKTSSPETFGSVGLGSSLFWVDPKRELSFIFLSSGLLGEGKNFQRFDRLSSLVGLSK